MSWLFFALLSPVVYTINNFIDKYVVSREVKDYGGMPIYSAIASFVFGTVFWIASGFPQLSFKDGLLIIMSGMFTVWAVAFYFKALSDEATSKIIILFQMGPVLMLISSYLFLRDFITLSQFLGFILIMVAVIGVSVERVNMTFKLSSVFFLILANQVFWTAAGILFKFVVESNSFVKVVAYESWGIALGGFALFTLFASIRKSFIGTLFTIKKYAFGIIFFNEGIFLTARLLSFYAISLGPIALVSVLGSASVFFAILLGWILTLFWPKVFNEDVSKQGLFKKVALSILAFLGIILVY